MGNFRGSFRGGAGRGFSRGRSFGSTRFSGSPRPQNQNRFRSRGANLNPMMFVRRAEVVEERVYQPRFKFSDFNLTEQLKRSIALRGYEQPTPIQDQTIDKLIEGKDLIGIANTGTGKTAAFLIPLINKVMKDGREKVLIVAPTRELAVQIQDEFRLFAGESIGCVLCIGGTPLQRQIMKLKRNPNFVIGTPGRLKDLDKRRVLRLFEYKSVVLDEVDRMLDMGFIHDVREIISKLPVERQSMFFSATMDDKTRSVANGFLRNPIEVSVKTGSTAKNIDQDIVRVNGRDKVEILHGLLNQEGFDRVLIFGRTKWGVDKLEIALMKRGFKVASIHGNKSQGQRQRALQQLKASEVKILLATDVASRGIDIQNVTHVINFDVPESYEDYVHRIGRTGRADKKGTALTFVD